MAADEKEEWEIGYSPQSAEQAPLKAQSVNFAASETLVGQLLDNRFLIEKDLTDNGADAGGFGVVYLARDLKLLAKETVVKILHQELLANSHIARKFQHEKEALIRLDHPNIVRILDSGYLSDGNPFMVMEYIPGYSLRKKLRDERTVSLDYCAHLVESVTNALGFVHSQQILHRDLKPENIMLTPREGNYEQVRIIDFGIARVENSRLAPKTEVPRVIGTPAYMAPEQLLGSVVQSPTIDIYALAIVIYEMLTGRLPFETENMYEMYNLRRDGVKILPSRLRPELPPAAEKILLAALAYNLLDRPPDARRFGRELAAALRGTINIAGETVTLDQPVSQHDAPTEVLRYPVQATIENEYTKPTVSEHPASTVNLENSVQTLIPEPPAPEKAPVSPGKAEKATFNWGIPAGALLGLIVIMAGLFLATREWGKGTSADQAKMETPTPVTSAKAQPSPAIVPGSGADAPSGGSPAAGQTRKIQYWLEVQKMRDGKKYEEPFAAAGTETFENGYLFRLNLELPAEGYFYLFADAAPDEPEKAQYKLLYPATPAGQISAGSNGGKVVQTDWQAFGQKNGIDKLWLIWTKERLAPVDEAAENAVHHQNLVTGQQMQKSLQAFLENNSPRKLSAAPGEGEFRKRTVITGEGDILAYRLELEHR